jgi:hypothetical protein
MVHRQGKEGVRIAAPLERQTSRGNQALNVASNIRKRERGLDIPNSTKAKTQATP